MAGLYFEEFAVGRVFEHPWRLVPMTANGQLALACYMGDTTADTFPLSSINVLTLRGDEIVALDGFLDPRAHQPFGLPSEVRR